MSKDATQKQSTDWINPPRGIKTTSLHSCLHDAYLEGIESDRLARTLRLTIDSWHIRKSLSLPNDFRFFLQFDSVTSVRAQRYTVWPGEFVRPEGITREEERHLVDEHQAKFRTESMGWDDLESQVNDPENYPCWIHEADLLAGKGALAFRTLFEIESPLMPWIFVQAAALTIERSDGQPIDLAMYIKYGEDYWEDWARKAD